MSQSSMALRMRVWHRYLGFFLAGVMAVYAISGIVLVFRKGSTFKREVRTEYQLSPMLSAGEVTEALDLRELKEAEVRGATLYWQNGQYDMESGVASNTQLKYPVVLDKLIHLHKSTTKDPLYYFNIFFGLSLLFFVVSAFWMYLPAKNVLRKGLLFAACGAVLLLIMLFV